MTAARLQMRLERACPVCVDHANTLQVRQQAAVHHAQTAAAEEEAADSKAYAAMEEMLGKAAAKV